VSATQVKVAAIAFALLSLALLVAAARDWTSGPADPSAAPSEPSGCRGGLILLGVTGVLVGGVWLVAPSMGWARDRALWVAFGVFLAVMTLIRPWWFWENWRARALRGMIGDEATAVLYLAIAGVMVWVGLYTDWTFGRR
jgi:hypothetical protein